MRQAELHLERNTQAFVRSKMGVCAAKSGGASGVFDSGGKGTRKASNGSAQAGREAGMGKAKGDVMQQGLIGVRFGRLVVTERLPSFRGGHSMWRCQCDCGQATDVLGTSLRKGATKSCGCLNRELASGLNLIHGKSDTKTHRIWRGMLERCGNQNHKSFPQYGGRGIKVCDRWQSFENFIADFIADMGECQAGYSIDRINPDGNYEPGNCRWASQKDQQNNRTNNHRLTMNGETRTIAEWCDLLGLSKSTVMDRLSKGWTAEKVLSKGDFRQ